VYICDSVFELGVGATEEQKSHVKDDAPIEECAEKIDEAIQMCPVTAIFKE
jgi:ferredoxin